LKKFSTAQGNETISIAGRLGDKIVSASSREILMAKAVKLKGKFILDGKVSKEEYGDSLSLTLDKNGQIVSRKKELWPGKDKCSAAVRFAWDENNLYLAVEVVDDVVANSAKVDQLWLEDCIELYLDTALDKNIFRNGLNAHQGKIICAPEPARFFVAGLKEKIDGILGKGIKLASRKTDKGYNIELQVPITAGKLQKGTVWGMDISFIDVDGKGKPKHQLMWTGRQSWIKPHSYGFLLLSE